MESVSTTLVVWNASERAKIICGEKNNLTGFQPISEQLTPYLAQPIYTKSTSKAKQGIYMNT